MQNSLETVLKDIYDLQLIKLQQLNDPNDLIVMDFNAECKMKTKKQLRFTNYDKIIKEYSLKFKGIVDVKVMSIRLDRGNDEKKELQSKIESLNKDKWAN